MNHYINAVVFDRSSPEHIHKYRITKVVIETDHRKHVYIENGTGNKMDFIYDQCHRNLFDFVKYESSGCRAFVTSPVSDRWT